MKSIIELKNTTKMYGSSVGVVDVSLKVPAGTIFGFLGPNGSGKSTTINMLLDFIRPTKGEVRLFDLDAQDKSVEVHKRIGFLAGDMALDRGLTGWQQIEYLGRLRGNYDKAYVTELAKRLECKLDRKFKTLSRGNKQKVGLIAALMHKPELLILDEPTSGLDPIMQAEFNKIILEHKARGGTTFISSHMLSEVQELCDEVGFIRAGRLVAVKPITELASESPKFVRVSAKKTKELAAVLKKLNGMKVQAVKNTLIQGAFSGDVNDLIKAVSAYRIDDFSVSDSDMEATFMSYYDDSETTGGEDV
jgi:ABC-2 type transport system ATP-binding protein